MAKYQISANRIARSGSSAGLISPMHDVKRKTQQFYEVWA